MNILRGVLTGILLWVLIFFEVSILKFGFKLAGQLYYFVHYLLLIILIWISASAYFKGRRIKSDAKNGLILGILFVVIGVILDAIITIPLFVKSYAFFLDPYLLAGLIETIVISVIVSALKR